MRTIKELLEVLLDNTKYYATGLCEWAADLKHREIITSEELFVLLHHIERNRPKFSWYNFFRNYDSQSRVFYWPEGHLKPRIEWIKKQIKKLEV